MSSDARGSSSHDRYLLIDHICDEFEAGWQQHQIPRMEDFLRRFDEESRATGFCELLRVELEVRNRRRESPSIAEYQRRFPGFAPQVLKVFRENTSIRNQS